MSNPKEKVVVKKVKAFPIPIDLWVAEGQPLTKGEILRLTLVGLQMTCKDRMFKVGETLIATFTLPVLKLSIKEVVVVAKTYDTFLDASVSEKTRITEFHFKTLSLDNEKSIRNFMHAIGLK